MSEPEIKKENVKKSHISSIDYNNKKITAIFYLNEDAGVYFINSFYENNGYEKDTAPSQR